jgi:hypothetical protein
MIRLRVLFMPFMIGAMVALASCAGGPGSEATEATWVPLGLVDADSTSIEIGVTRTACANGVTGALQDPLVDYGTDRIVITARVEPNGLTEADCQGNDVVRTVVELTEPVGQRELFDAICLDRAKLDYAWCRDDGGVRWAPPADGSGEDVVSIPVDNWLIIDAILDHVISNEIVDGGPEVVATATRIRQAGWDAANAIPGEAGETGWPQGGAVLKIRFDPTDGAFVLDQLEAARNAAVTSGGDGSLESDTAAAFSAAWNTRM